VRLHPLTVIVGFVLTLSAAIASAGVGIWTGRTFGSATAVPLTTDTGYFWFFHPNNVEVVTKVLNGCSTNGHYWFFASGLTNVGVQINVTDMVTGASKPYSNSYGTPFPPIQDTAAFLCP